MLQRIIVVRLLAAASLMVGAVAAAHAAPVTLDREGKEAAEPPMPAAAQPALALPPLIEQLAAGHAALAKQDLDAAQRAFEAARKLSANAVGPLLGLAEVARLRGNGDEASTLLAAALKADPFSAEAHRAWGRLRFASGDAVGAETSLRRAAELGPNDALTQMDLGEVYMQGLQRPDAAAAAFGRAVSLAPNHAGARYGLGNALMALGRLDDAVAALQESGRLAPQNVLPLLALGQARLAQRQPEAAIAEFARALDMQPRLVAAIDGLGDAHALRGDHEQAAAQYAKAAGVAPTSPWPQLKLGNALLALKRGDDAERAYLAAIKANDRFAPGYNNLAALAVQRRDRLAQALTWAQKAVELEPRVAAYRDTLGTVRLARNEIDLAIQACREAVALPPPSSDHYFTLGTALARKGARQEAVAALREALKHDPNFPQAAEARRRIAELGG